MTTRAPAVLITLPEVMPLELDIFHPLFNRHLYLIIFEQYVRQNAQQHVLPNYKSIFYHNLHIAFLEDVKLRYFCRLCCPIWIVQ